MARFKVLKHVSLAFLGEGWEDAELVLSGLSFGESQELLNVNFDDDKEHAKENSEFVIKFLQNHFVRGTAFDGDKLVELTKEDVADLPIEAVNKALEEISGTGNPDPKS